MSDKILEIVRRAGHYLTQRDKDEIRIAVGDWEHEIRMEIRAGYDRAIADCWKAKVSELESKLAQAGAIKFPRETKPDNILGGWTISFDYLMTVKKLQNTNEDPVDLETIESVLLSVELAASNTEKDGE